MCTGLTKKVSLAFTKPLFCYRFGKHQCSLGLVEYLLEGRVLDKPYHGVTRGILGEKNK